MRIIDLLDGIPNNITSNGILLRRFLGITLQTLIYSPDKSDVPFSDKLKREVFNLYGDPQKLEEELERSFFNILYVERIEEEELCRLLPSRELILLHGHIGTGKTTILRKIEFDHTAKGMRSFIYINAKEVYEKSPSETGVFFEWFKKYFFDLVFERFVPGFVEEWQYYKVMNDPNFVEIKSQIIEDFGKKFESLIDWQKYLNTRNEFRKLISFGGKADITTLLKFVVERREILPIVCFDNVDRFPTPEQSNVLSFSLKLTEAAKVPVIVAIRETNIRKLISEAMVSGGRSDLLSDLHLIEYLERLNAGEVEYVPMMGLSQGSIEAILRNRINFVKDHIRMNLGIYKDLIEFVRLSLRGDAEALPETATYDEFIEIYWKTLKAVIDAFSDMNISIQDIFNDNCREMMRFFYNFICTIALNPEPEYNMESIIVRHKKSPPVEYTRLRTFLYKWLICNGNIIIKEDSPIPNIYNFETPLKFLYLRILEFLYNWDRRYPNRPLKFIVVSNFFHQMGVRRNDLLEAIDYLGKREGLYELGYLWINRLSPTINNQTTLEILPAGKYFVKTFSVSREYAFWNILLVEHDPLIYNERFNFIKLYDDEFKLNIIQKFIEEKLLPETKSEINFVRNCLKIKNLKCSTLYYFKQNFSVHGHLYLYRLITSVIHSIDTANLEENQKREQTLRFYKLLNEAEEIERENDD